MHALLLATASTELDVNGRTALQHAGEPAVSSAASLPLEILKSASRGELRKVVEWLRKGEAVDALGSVLAADGRTTTMCLLHAAATNGQLYMAYELLKRGANVNIVGSRGETACGQSACLDRHSS